MKDKDIKIIKTINKAVEKELKEFGAYNKNILKELVDSTYDEYLLNLEFNKNEDEALLNALDSVKNMVSSNYEKDKSNRFKFSLFVSFIAFVVTLIIAIIGWLTINVLYTFSVIYPILAFIALVYLIYLIVTHKKRNYLDYIVLGIIFVSIITIIAECFIYFYRPRTGDYYYELYYEFPGLLRYCTYWLASMEPIRYELSKTTFLFDPTLIASFICFSLTLTMYLIEKKKNHFKEIDK